VENVTFWSTLPAIASLGTGFFVWIIQRNIEKRDSKRAAHNEVIIKARQQESLAIMRMVRCIGKLSYANAVAVKEGKVNGAMDKALQDYETTCDLLDAFIEEQSVAHLH
jgi:hypothetical protein